MARHRDVWPVRWMSRALSVSASGFYEWLVRPESERARANRIALARIRESFEASDRTYGSPRVWRDLRDWNVPCSENRTARLMQRAGLQARRKRRQPPYDTGERSVVAPNVLNREFAADAPDQTWVADFTYIWTGEGWLYVAVVLDLYSRMIVGWSMHAQMSAQLVTDALLMAVWRRRPKHAALLHHSDQGSQGEFQRSSQHLVEGGVVWDGHQDGLRNGQAVRRCDRRADRVSIGGKPSRRFGCGLPRGIRAKTQHWRAACRSRLERDGFAKPAGWRQSVWDRARADICHLLNAKNSRC